jgi:IPT/TIG domain
MLHEGLLRSGTPISEVSANRSDPLEKENLMRNLQRTLLGVVFSILCLGSVAFAQNDGRATTHVFAQFADGRFGDGTYYRSALYISNPSSTASGACTVTLFGMVTSLENASGALVSAGAFSVSISGDSWGIFRTLGTSTFQSGYATVSCTVSVNAVVIYSYYSATGIKLSEAAVFSSSPGTSLQILSDHRGGGKLGIAIVNDTDSTATATITAANQSGQTVGSKAVTMPGRSQYVKFLDEMLPGLPADHLGQVIVTSSGPQLGAIGLRYTGTAFTTIPSTVRQTAGVVTPPVPSPSVTSISPVSGNPGATVAVTLTGANFAVGATTVSVSGFGIEISGTQVVSTTSLNAVFSIASGAALGARTVTVSTAAGASNGTTFSVTATTTKSFNQTQTERLFGTWLFSYKLVSTFTDTFALNDVQPSTSTPGEWNIFGYDQYDRLVIAEYAASLGEFILFDPGTTIDEFFAFDFTGTNTVSGCAYVMPKSSSSLGNCYPMTGVRTSTSAVSAITDYSSNFSGKAELQKIGEVGKQEFSLADPEGDQGLWTIRTFEAMRADLQHRSQ